MEEVRARKKERWWSCCRQTDALQAARSKRDVCGARSLLDLVKDLDFLPPPSLTHLETCKHFPMQRWTPVVKHATHLRRQCLNLTPMAPPYRNATTYGGARRLATSTIWRRRAEDSATIASGNPIEPFNVEKIGRRNKANAWLDLLEPTLPSHLKEPGQKNGARKLSPTEIFKVLSSAESATLSYYKRDVFSYIGYERGRWNVVIWLMKHLVDSFANAPPNTYNDSSNVLCQWKNDTPLEELTRAPIDLLHPSFLQRAPSNQQSSLSLREGTLSQKSNRIARKLFLRHDVLGMIWRSLGSMTISCAGSDIKPEILEIIAVLHHQGFMPSSIYDSKPSNDPTVIQQSPILNLMSSRILTSLSDAAWRAHERSIVEQSKKRGGTHASIHHEIPGSGYRVRVAGLKPEVWLELILWSCLHGGWISEGMELLENLHRSHNQQKWRPLSWRSLVLNQPKGTRDWEKVEYLFNNWTHSSMDLDEPIAPVSVQRTVSSEVVNAYVDASISVVRLTNGERDRSASQTIKFINSMQKFLERSGLGLGAGSWDAVVIRLFDLQDSQVYQPALFDRIIRLSPDMGQEIAASNIHSLPDYVFDGTAAIFGLFHRALYYRIQEADVEGALRLFASLQERADENKRRSVADFFQKRDLFSQAASHSNTGQFNDNYGRIDYPGFYVQIPPTILGPFMELVTDAKAYDFGKWLLYSEEIDGPIIPQALYGDPSVTPALVRFAAETGDKTLLSRLIKIRAAAANEVEPTLPRKVLQSFLESQINLTRWDAAVKILQHMKDTYGLSWNLLALCHLTRVILMQVRGAQDGDDTCIVNLNRARGLFRQMVRGGYERKAERPDYVQEQIDNLLVVLASIDGKWADFSDDSQMVNGYRVFNLPSKAFNLILEGVVHAYGSQTGRRLIGIFWSHQVRGAQAKETRGDRQSTDPPFSSFGRTLPENVRRQRTEVRLAGSQNRKVIIYAGLRPDLMTIRIVLKTAIEELDRESDDAQQRAENWSVFAESPAELVEAEADELNNQRDPEIDISPTGMVVWGVRCLKRLGMNVDDIHQELTQSLSRPKLDRILEKSPNLLARMEEQEDQEDENGEDAEDGESKGAGYEERPVDP